MSEEKRRMLAGELYNAGDPELVAERRRCSLLCERFNSTSATDREGGRAALRELLGAFGDASTVMPPFRCDYGYNITLGDRSFLNYGSIVLDVAPVAIGHDVQIATNVQILTATHPLDPAERRSGLGARTTGPNRGRRVAGWRRHCAARHHHRKGRGGRSGERRDAQRGGADGRCRESRSGHPSPLAPTRYGNATSHTSRAASDGPLERQDRTPALARSHNDVEATMTDDVNGGRESDAATAQGDELAASLGSGTGPGEDAGTGGVGAGGDLAGYAGTGSEAGSAGLDTGIGGAGGDLPEGDDVMGVPGATGAGTGGTGTSSDGGGAGTDVGGAGTGHGLGGAGGDLGTSEEV